MVDILDVKSLEQVLTLGQGGVRGGLDHLFSHNRHKQFKRSSSRMDPSESDMDQGDEGDYTCSSNCSGNGVCFNGSCYCQIQFDGQECNRINFAYHVAFASIFFLLALTSLIQLVMCIHAGK